MAVNLYDITTDRLVATGLTLANGTLTSDSIPMDRYYRAQVMKSDYFTTNETVLLTASAQTIDVELEPRSVGSIQIQAIDQLTHEPVPNAWVLVMDPDSYEWLSEGHTSDEGLFLTRGLPDRNFLVIVESDYHVFYEATFHHPGDATHVIELQSYQNGQVRVTVVDGDTGLPISGAHISVGAGVTQPDVDHGVTDAAGQWTSPTIAGDFYQVVVFAEGYWYVETGVTVVGGVATLDVEMFPSDDVGPQRFTVVDAWGQPISGVKITARFGWAVIATGETDANGVWESAPLQYGSYAFDFSHPQYWPHTEPVLHRVEVDPMKLSCNTGPESRSGSGCGCPSAIAEVITPHDPQIWAWLPPVV